MIHLSGWSINNDDVCTVLYLFTTPPGYNGATVDGPEDRVSDGDESTVGVAPMRTQHPGENLVLKFFLVLLQVMSQIPVA